MSDNFLNISEEDLMDAPGEGTMVDLEEEGPFMVDGAEMTEGEDGSLIVDFKPKKKKESTHNENLAEILDQDYLQDIGADLNEAIKQDKESRIEWVQTYLAGIDSLGIKVEKKEKPFMGATATHDPLMARAVISFQSVAMKELLPPNGPVRTEILGDETDELVEKAERVKLFMNNYLVEQAPEYYPDHDTMLFWLPLVGSTFTKVYNDPIKRRPVAYFIPPENFIVSYSTTDLETCPRMTQKTEMSFYDIRMRQLRGVFREGVALEPLQQTDQSRTQEKIDFVTGLTPTYYHNDQKYGIYECHVDLDLQGYEHLDEEQEPTGIPLPYIVTLDEMSGEILSLRRNWEEGDPDFKKKEYFVHHKFMPGLGFYGFGYSHLLGGMAEAMTKILRELVDCGMISNFPGGLRVKGLRIDDNDKAIGPTEFREVDTGGLPIREAFMPMPFNPPSGILKELRTEMGEQAEKLAATTQLPLGENTANIPVGTMVAMIEQSMTVQSTIMQRLHYSMKKEFKLFFNLFSKILPEEPYPFLVPGGKTAIMREDFHDQISIIPVSDPNITSSTQRIIRVDSLLRLAQSAPQLHNLREIYARLYREMGIHDIDKVLLPENVPMAYDPITENQNAMMNKPLKAELWQDHEAHIAVHQILQENPNMQAHIQEHLAMKFRLDIERVMGIQLPPPEEELPHEIQNQIAQMAAQASEQIKQQIMKDKPPAPLDPTVVLLEDVKVKIQKIEADAEALDKKLEVELFKANLKHESEILKIRADKQIAFEKMYVDLSTAKEVRNPDLPEAVLEDIHREQQIQELEETLHHDNV